jgi:hypothetical protein
MTSVRQANANRANARASTGPKATAGKLRTKNNALRHGLAVSVLQDEKWAPEVEALANRIAGVNADAERRILARAIGEAQIDLTRIRGHRRQIIEYAFENRDVRWRNREDWRRDIREYRRLRKVADNLNDGPENLLILDDILDKVLDLVDGVPMTGVKKRVTILAKMSRELAAIERYERRALSRRKFAIWAFDKVTAETS